MAMRTMPISGLNAAPTLPARFDPAFAGAHLPALLAEIKPTFHNIFAHPDWLYHPDDAAKQLDCHASVRAGVLHVQHNWEPSPLRRAFLESKQQHVWRPLLAAPLLAGQAWHRYMRLALFCCPTLVMNLRAGWEIGTTLSRR